jgi:hypothetical protein
MYIASRRAARARIVSEKSSHNSTCPVMNFFNRGSAINLYQKLSNQVTRLRVRGSTDLCNLSQHPVVLNNGHGLFIVSVCGSVSAGRPQKERDNILNRFLMLSTLSSSRPLVFPRSSRRASIISSVVEKNRTRVERQT